MTTCASTPPNAPERGTTFALAADGGCSKMTQTVAGLPRVALVEDDDDLRDSIADFLSDQGYPVWGVASAEEFYRRMARDQADVLVLDLNLPGEDGISVARHVGGLLTAVVILSGRSALEDRLAGLEAGANRFLVKPIDLRELMANINAAWDAAPKPHPPSTGATGWRLDAIHWTLMAPNGAIIGLTSGEYKLLRSLFDAGNGQTVTKAALSSQLGGVAEDFHRIDVMLARLRKKVRHQAGLPVPVKSIHARGLVFTAQIVS